MGTLHPNTAASLSNFAEVHMSQRKYKEAELLFRQAFAIRQQTLGKEHPDTAGSLWWLAVLAKQKRHWKEAEKLYKRAASIYEIALGSSHFTTQEIQRQYIAFLKVKHGSSSE